MLSIRAAGPGLAPAFRRTAFIQPILRNPAALRLALSKRSIQIQSLPPSASQEISDSQRIKRPSSPHFTIYQPQLTWLGSIANRVTGSALSVLLYGFAISYLTLPVIGIPFTSADIVHLAASLPDYATYTLKALLAAPFAFHSLNGLRHLGWDAGKFLTLKGAYRSGYVVLGATAASTIALVLM
ncbi:succinate dehydrogenase cytochrome b560 subunit [Rickenella mellea]|uniref:Succinate dehydrogenase cytochrome b560 subunit n=1 Tax=Rickenella mellea TaxID=50990 RepID=A0A4Y7QF45_9AGAM|nr:succinate dehydrogenase cytochrome b560 subunit [Rickenella mellea]